VTPEDRLVASDVKQDFPIWEPSPDIAQQTTIAAFLRQHQLADLQALLDRADASPAGIGMRSWNSSIFSSSGRTQKSWMSLKALNGRGGASAGRPMLF